MPYFATKEQQPLHEIVLSFPSFWGEKEKLHPTPEAALAAKGAKTGDVLHVYEVRLDRTVVGKVAFEEKEEK